MKIGIDNVLISRMEKVPERFPERYLSERELKEFQTRSPALKASYLAGRFAAKEAFVKATGRKAVKYRSIEILDDGDGKPHLYVDGVETGHVSITHDFIASAIVWLDD